MKITPPLYRFLSITSAALAMFAAIPVQARTWTSSDGRSLEAEFVAKSGNTVTLKRANDGKSFTLPLDKLSDADQEWIKGGAASTATPAKPLEGPFAKLVTGDWALSEHDDLPFMMYAAKDLDAAKTYPLLLALHGKSDNNVNGKQIGGWISVFANPANYAERPCIIVAPLCYQPFGGSGSGWGDKPGKETIRLVKDLCKSLPVDEKRIYIIGYSMGGFGTCHLMESESRMFAAGVAVAGCSGAGSASTFRNKPLWLHHAADDKLVDVQRSRDFAEALKRSKTFKYTEYPNGGHGIVGRVFDSPQVHTWLFAQARK